MNKRTKRSYLLLLFLLLFSLIIIYFRKCFNCEGKHT